MGLVAPELPCSETSSPTPFRTPPRNTEQIASSSARESSSGSSRPSAGSPASRASPLPVAEARGTSWNTGILLGVRRRTGLHSGAPPGRFQDARRRRPRRRTFVLVTKNGPASVLCREPPRKFPCVQFAHRPPRPSRSLPGDATSLSEPTESRVLIAQSRPLKRL